MPSFYELWQEAPETCLNPQFEALSDVEVFKSELHGDGMKSLGFVKKNSVVFRERPLHFLQSLPNKSDVLVCSNCLRFLGNNELQLKFLTKEISRQTLIESIKAGDLDSSQSIILCQHDCGEFYCSSLCRDHHWSTCHCLLCTGQISEDEAEKHPLILFKQHAVRSNEIFLLCGDVFAKSCICIDNLSKISSINTAAFQTLQPYQSYVRNLWWDAAVAPKGTNPKTLAKTLKNLVRESWALLNETLRLDERKLDTMLSAETLSRTIGMFEQNNVGIRMESPLASSVRSLLPSDTEGIKIVRSYVEKVIEQLATEEEVEFEEDVEEEDANDEDDEKVEDEDEEVTRLSITNDSTVNISENDDSSPELSKLLDLINDEGGLNRIFPPLDGTAFYKWVCKINHSCDPNVVVIYSVSESMGLHAELTALKDIEEGEELVQSYIDQSLPYSSRQKALKDYGFNCNCNKCIIENPISNSVISEKSIN